MIAAYALLLNHNVKTTKRVGVLVAACFAGMTWMSCTGGQETKASEKLDEPAQTAQQPAVNAVQLIQKISPAIPIYEGAAYRPDLSRRDETTFKNQFGQRTQVYTLATDDSFPQVWHYYVTYLAQYRGYEPPPPYPPENRNWRTIQIPLNQAMQNPFIPGDGLENANADVVLQIAETEAEPQTVIRYIVVPKSAATQIAAMPVVTQTSGVKAMNAPEATTPDAIAQAEPGPDGTEAH